MRFSFASLIIPALLLLPNLLFGQVFDSTQVAGRVDSLIQVSRALTAKGDLQQALNVNEQAEQFALSHHGKQSPVYANTCFNRGRALFLAGGPPYYEEAEKWYMLSKNIRETTLGKHHPDYAWSVNNLGAIYENRGDLKTASEHYLEALLIRKNVLGKSHPHYMGSVGNLANVYYRLGRLDEAMTLCLERMAFAEKSSGKESYAYAQELNLLALLYDAKSDYNQAESIHQQSLQIKAQKIGKNHSDYALSLANLGRIYLKKGQQQRAISLFQEANQIWKKSNNINDQINHAENLVQLGRIYAQSGMYKESAEAFQKGLAMQASLMGTESPVYIQSLTIASELYRTNGEAKKALAYCLQAKEIQERNGIDQYAGKYAATLTRLVDLYVDTEDFEKALPLALQAQAILKELNEDDDPFYGRCLQNLSYIYLNQKDFDKALPPLLEAQNILKTVIGTENHPYGVCLNNLGIFYQDVEDFEKARQYYLEAGALYTRLYGEEHPEYTRIQRNLALLEFQRGDFSAAAKYFLSANEGAIRLIEKASTYSSENELMQFQNGYSKSMGTINYFIQHYNQSPLIELACNNSLYLKNSLLFNAKERERAIQLLDETTQDNYEEWKSCHYQLSKLYAQPISERDQKLIASLESQANDLEKGLADRSAGFVISRKQVKWTDIQEKLEPGEAAIELVHFQFLNPVANDSTLYGAFIIQKNNPLPIYVPLFEERQLTPLIKGAAGGGNFTKINAIYSQEDLYNLIWKPLEAHIKDIHTLYIAPSGLLHRININAMQTQEGQMLGKSRQLILLGSTRQLITTKKKEDNFPLTGYVAGGIRYSMEVKPSDMASLGARSAEVTNYPNFQPDSSQTRAGNLQYLPASAIEAQTIFQVVKSASYAAQLDTGLHATEDKFKTLGKTSASPTLIHLATHGFFFPDPKSKSVKSEKEPFYKMSDHPMLRSGLILAGAQNAWSGYSTPANREDGILTAYEISQMNLSNTELVVLSACETGLGDIAGNEGVYGLQRAFKIAGAKYLIMSLWKVDDKSTKAFMTTFYDAWLIQKMSIPEAFRQTQQVMQKQYPNPYDWAGFILVE
jgi:CHAT domain-containing protein/Flp pilus assembly protein TadD